MRSIVLTFLIFFAALNFTSSSEKILVLSGATIYPSPNDVPISNGLIVIKGEKIESVGSKDQIKLPLDAAAIDCNGMFITAGFQNSHVHFTEDKWNDARNQSAEKLNQQLEEMLTRYGFTTVVDTGSHLENTIALRNRIHSKEVKGPRIFTAGSPLYPENGIPYYLKDLPPNILAILPTPATPQAAANESIQHIKGGADIIKLFTGSWVSRGKVLPMNTEIATAASNEAHREAKLVFAHASNLAGLEVALAARVDVVAHALDDDRGWTTEHAKRMKANNMSMIPTLTLFSGPDFFKFILKEVGDFSSAGGQVLFGTDVGYIKNYDTAEEYVYMSQAGLSWQQILASLTTAPAERFNESKRRGKIAAGMDADLVVLASDPQKNVTAFADVKQTFRAGELIYSSQ
jgi:imidazolonepropionase-like amidohydrolase